jgi:hypothetical protein
MHLLFDYDPEAGTMRWQFKTYDETADKGIINGNYYMLTRHGRTPLPAQGVLRMTTPTRDCFRIRFEADDGSQAYGPPLILPNGNAQPRHQLARKRRPIRQRPAGLSPGKSPNKPLKVRTTRQTQNRPLAGGISDRSAYA